ncbi:MAG TPA: urea transporter [Polyangiales bacterium]|nr:urea transporter [Polyangiales bacterium]
MRQYLDTVGWFLRLYAGCFFSSSTAVGAMVFCATALEPHAGILAALAVGTAVLTASALGLISEQSPPSVYAYSALFIGMGAMHTFANPVLALALATLGAAAAALLTAAVRGVLSRVGLPALTLPFTLVYMCAISAGSALGAEWSIPTHVDPSPYLDVLPPLVRLFFESLAAILFSPRAEVGFAVFIALCASGVHAPLLAVLAFSINLLLARLLVLPTPVAFAALINSTFTAIGLGIAWYSPNWLGYVRAMVGACLCVLLTVALSAPLARLELMPMSLPFNLSIYAVLLIANQRASQQTIGKGPAYEHSGNASASYG